MNLNVKWTWFHRLGSPRWFYQKTQCWLPWLSLLTLSLLITGLVWGLAFAPEDAKQGNSFRIIYVHVPASVVALAGYYMMAIAGAVGLIWRIKLSFMLMRSAAPIGAALTFIALVTGAGGGIGKSIAKKFVAEGAVVILLDISEKNLKEAEKEFNKDNALSVVCDINNSEAIQNAIEKTCLNFGGIDIVVHSAGLAISKPLSETTPEDWDMLQNILVKGQFELFKQATAVLKIQEKGGNFITIASKNGLVAGPNNVAYGTAKAAQQHMTRLLAAELAKEKIRVNTVNPDGVIIGSKIWEGDWAAGRAKAYGITVEELPAFYAKRNLLNKIIYPSDIANGVFAYVGVLEKSTGNIINVDGGMANAFVR